MIAPLFDLRLWTAISFQVATAPVQDFWAVLGTRTSESKADPLPAVHEDEMAVSSTLKTAA